MSKRSIEDILYPTDVPEYQANIEAVNLGLREDQRAATVPDLFPNIAYRFRVRAINDFGRGQEASKGSGKQDFNSVPNNFEFIVPEVDMFGKYFLLF